MPTCASSNWCAVDSRDVATARMVLSAAQQTFGNPATLVQKLLGLSSDDYQEVVQSLSASGASYVDIVAAYLHNLRVLYDDCGGQFPPEIFSLSTQSTTEQMVKDVCPTPPARSPKSSLPTGMFQPPLSPTSATSPRIPPSPSAPLPKAVSYSTRRSLDLLTSPRSTLIPPTHSYPYSTSPTSPSSVLLSPRPLTPPSAWAGPQDPSPSAAWQAQYQYQQLLAQTSMALPPVSPLQFASAEALLSGQAPPMSLPPSMLLPPHSLPPPQIPTQQQQYLSALAASLQMPTSAAAAPTLSDPTYLMLQHQQQQQQQQAPMPCAYSAACLPMQQVQQEAGSACLPAGYGLNYDSIKRIWEGPSAMSHLTHHLHRLV